VKPITIAQNYTTVLKACHVLGKDSDAKKHMYINSTGTSGGLLHSSFKSLEFEKKVWFHDVAHSPVLI
jgi:hypothetical protein